MEVGGADALAYDVPLCPTRDEGEFLLVHDVLQLLTNLTNLERQNSHYVDLWALIGNIPSSLP